MITLQTLTTNNQEISINTSINTAVDSGNLRAQPMNHPLLWPRQARLHQQPVRVPTLPPQLLIVPQLLRVPRVLRVP